MGGGATTPRSLRTRSAVLITSASLALAACAADDTEGAADQPFADGDVVRVVLGGRPGGGFDTQARVLQPYLEEALEQETGADLRVVVENMPGAAHRIATEHVYNSPADGARLIFSNAQLMVTNDVVRDAEYDITEMTGLGSAGRLPHGVVVNTSLDWPGDTFADVIEYSANEDVLFSHPGLDADIALMQAILREAGVEFGLSPIHVGQTSDQVASLLRGETAVAMTTAGSLREAVDDNPDQLRMVAILGCEPDESIPEVQTIVAQNLPRAEEICNTIGYDDRVFLGPPDLPEDVTQILRDALQAALSHEEYVEQIAQARLAGDWSGGADVETLITDMVATYEKYDIELPE